MIAILLMVVGGLAWLAGELYGVFTSGPTTSGGVWWLEKGRWYVRVIVASQVLALGYHFVFHGPLL